MSACTQNIARAGPITLAIRLLLIHEHHKALTHLGDRCVHCCLRYFRACPRRCHGDRSSDRPSCLFPRGDRLLTAKTSSCWVTIAGLWPYQQSIQDNPLIPEQRNCNCQAHTLLRVEKAPESSETKSPNRNTRYPIQPPKSTDMEPAR